MERGGAVRIGVWKGEQWQRSRNMSGGCRGDQTRKVGEAGGVQEAWAEFARGEEVEVGDAGSTKQGEGEMGG